MNELKNKKHKKLHNRCILILFLLLTGIHILSWNSKVFTDWYRLHIFPVWTGTLGRLSGLFHRSVGEVLIVTGICLLLMEAILLFLYVGTFIVRRLGRSEKRAKAQNQNQEYAQNKRKKFWKWNARVIIWILLYIYGTETLNCYILYHAPTVEEQYFDTEEEYGTEELVAAYTEVVTKANELSEQVSRDARGQAVFDGTREQLYEACKRAMAAQGGRYPYLAGYYPDPKPIRASHFMSQQYLLGIYFPFTMEANYNTVMYPVNVPATVCHEYSHLKGIIMEDEANYFGFIACIESEDPYLQYSGYLSVIGYLSRQVKLSVPDAARQKLVKANEQVRKDDVFLTKEQWEQVEKKAVVSTETVNQATNSFLEKNLTLNGIEDGIQSYSRVVRLVIRYFSE